MTNGYYQKHIDTLSGTLILFYFLKKAYLAVMKKINNCPTLVELHCSHFFYHAFVHKCWAVLSKWTLITGNSQGGSQRPYNHGAPQKWNLVTCGAQRIRNRGSHVMVNSYPMVLKEGSQRLYI